jgi:hypothetical protein
MATPIESRPIIMICGCQKYRPYMEAAMRRMLHPNWQVVGILGDPTLTEARLDGAILTLPVPDTYEGLPAKVHAAFAWLTAKIPNLIGIFKTDDDIVFPDKAAIHKQIMDNRYRPYWGLRVGECKEDAVRAECIENRFNDKSLQPRHQAAERYAFGGGYWVGREALPILVSAGDMYRASVLEDVCTGHLLNAAGIIPPRLFLPHVEHPREPAFLSAAQISNA